MRERLGVHARRAEYADLPYLWRAPGLRPCRSPPTGWCRRCSRHAGGLGIDLDAQANVHLDTEVRELKSPRAFCSPVRVPDEIYLVVLPQGGQDDYQALLHEAGHTEHFAHVRPGLPFEYRHLGDNAVTEGFAFLFDHLLLNRRWLDVTWASRDADEFLRFANISDLYFMRRYVAKLAYEIELHKQTAPSTTWPRAYAAVSATALMVDVPPESYLSDVDDGFYCASYLRAWLFEGALRMMLQDRLRHGVVPPTRGRRPGSRSCGRTVSTSPPSGFCSSTAAAGWTPTRCGITSSARWAASLDRRFLEEAEAPVARRL